MLRGSSPVCFAHRILIVLVAAASLNPLKTPSWGKCGKSTGLDLCHQFGLFWGRGLVKPIKKTPSWGKSGKSTGLGCLSLSCPIALNSIDVGLRSGVGFGDCFGGSWCCELRNGRM